MAACVETFKLTARKAMGKILHGEIVFSITCGVCAFVLKTKPH